MQVDRLTSNEVNRLGRYLGRYGIEWNGGPVRKRRCPNCIPENHRPEDFCFFAGVADVDMRGVGSDFCRQHYWRCPACSHGEACSEYREGAWRRVLGAADGPLRRRLLAKRAEMRAFAKLCA